MYLKLIFWILFLLIFVTISIERNCKCPKNGGKVLYKRRFKRGNKFCSCAGGGGGSRKEHSEGSGHGGTRSSGRISSGSGRSELEETGHGGPSHWGPSHEGTSSVSGFGVGFGGSSDVIHGEDKKKILFICDNFFFSNVQLNVMLANALSEKYFVHMLVYSKENGVDLPSNSNIHITYVPINKNRLNRNYIANHGLEYAYLDYKNSQKCFLVGIYYEIITNEELLKWLLQQNYSAGIADFNEMSGAFAIFEVLGIENTFDVTNSVFFPGHLHFLGIDVTELQVPGYTNAVPGEWIHGGFTREARKKHAKYHKDAKKEDLKKLTAWSNIYYEELVMQEIITEGQIPNLIKLYKKINYHFVNQHKFVNFEQFPQHEKIIYIGGILVENKGTLTNSDKNPTDGKANCVVYVSFGMINIEGMGHYNLEKMLDTFTNYGQCNFMVRLGEDHYLKGAYIGTNISFEGFVNQQEILAKQNTKLFISHCGVNSLTESVYAGVPLICIPIGGDQHYLSSLVEHLNIGVYVKADNLGNDTESLEEFGEQLGKALEDIIGERSINQNVYQEAVNQLRTKVLDDFHDNDNPWIKNIFIGKIEEYIGE